MGEYGAKLAKLWKELENQETIESTIGEVINPPPNLRISIWNSSVILEPTQLYMNDRLFNDHTREYKLEGTIGAIDVTTTKQDIKTYLTPLYLKKDAPGDVSSPNKWVNTIGESQIIGASTGSRDFKITEGTIVNTDTLKVGDLVKLTPTEDAQIWFVDFKIRKLGGE